MSRVRPCLLNEQPTATCTTNPCRGSLFDKVINVAADSVSDHATEHLRYIRETMASAGAFTAISGRGGVAMGVIGCVAALAAAEAPSERAWLATWLAAALL